ncbi:hypothetical protein [Actinoplanes sp. L3-i22]|uniref:hypothetical protein n=1 Tax=Actinoplanes sp. L3-i22 TaxID=2836373 RepID=UPI001C84D1C5|nr:hypothetical protein [Actinoplanes sp. L3-i22]
MARWRGGAVARWRGGAVARWRGGAAARGAAAPVVLLGSGRAVRAWLDILPGTP